MTQSNNISNSTVNILPPKLIAFKVSQDTYELLRKRVPGYGDISNLMRELTNKFLANEVKVIIKSQEKIL